MKKPCLVLIDVQEGFHDPYWGRRNNPQFEANVTRLLTHWRATGGAVIHVQHHSTEVDSPLRPDRPGVAFMPCATPHMGEPIVVKRVNSGFIGTALEALLRQAGHQQVIIAGLSTDHCVSTTTRMAANLGFEVLLATDATATFNRTGADGRQIDAATVHEVQLASLNGEFATLKTTDALLDL